MLAVSQITDILMIIYWNLKTKLFYFDTQLFWLNSLKFLITDIYNRFINVHNYTLKP